MLQLKSTKKTLKNYLDACYASSGRTNKAFSDELSYIGTFYESDFLSKAILTSPSLSIDTFGEKDIQFKVELKPEGQQKEQVELLDNYLKAISKGFLGNTPEPIKELKPRYSLAESFLAQNSALSDVQNYNLNVYLNDPEVYRQDTTINGTKYYQYTLVDRYDFGGGTTYEHKVHSLFKEKTSEGENFFSALVSKNLSKKDSKKVLDVLADENLTGFFIGGYVFGTEVYGYTEHMAVGSEVSISRVGTDYLVKGFGSLARIDAHRLKKLEVIRVSDFRYNLKVFIDNLVLTIYIG